MANIQVKQQADGGQAQFNLLVDARYGRVLFNRHDRYVGRSLALYGEYCEGEVDIFRQICRPGDTVVEVGANIGAHTLPLARFVGAAGHVYAFEPQRLVFQTLCANIALNSLANTTCLPYGVAAVAGTLVSREVDYQKANNFGGISLASLAVQPGELVPAASRAAAPVQLVRLDNVIPEGPVKLLKIDVEGMESEVISGSENLIRAQRPLIYVENDRRDKSQQLIEQLWALDYDLYWSFGRLYNAANFLGNATNVFGNIRAVNMLGVPKASAFKVEKFVKVEDSSFHPMADAGA
jgi:FkbM family methyltransferase